MKRKIYEKLLEWKQSKASNPLMVLGVRQCGKTYILDKFCKNEFKSYKYVNLLENSAIVELYNSSLTSDEKYTRLKVLLNFDLDEEDSVLFIDEIQESEKLISELKYFSEKHGEVKIVCAGSLLGVKLKRSHFSFPVGKVKFLHMNPMDFEEFLLAMGEESLLNMIKECFSKNKQMTVSLHEKAMNLYRVYLVTGGMPASVKNMVDNENDYINYDSTILKDIVESYFNDMDKYVTSDSEALKIKRIYESLPTQLANTSHKFQFSKIANDARSREYVSPLDWLEASNMVQTSFCVKTPEIPLKAFVDLDTFKLYLSDVGILNSLLGISTKDILTDNISSYKGVIVENYVANQLASNGNVLYYWVNSNQSEIDFLIYNDDGIIPVEVKASDNTQSKSLKNYMRQYHPRYALRVSSKDFGYNPETKIKSIPLYAVFLIS